MNVSNKTYHIKETPYFVSGDRIVGDFTSANHLFNEISIDTYEGDLEIWYLDRTTSANSVLAYSSGEWEVEYRYITFANNVELTAEDFQSLTNAYDEYIPTRTLYITYNGVRKLGKINGKIKGSFSWQGTAYPFDNTAWEYPEQDGSNLTITQVLTATQSGGDLSIT